jgi:hypothetical protein
MSPKRVFTPEKAKKIGEALGVDWTKFDVEQFRVGMDVDWSTAKWTRTPMSPTTTPSRRGR